MTGATHCASSPDPVLTLYCLCTACVLCVLCVVLFRFTPPPPPAPPHTQKVLVSHGSEVRAGDDLLIIEAMKVRWDNKSESEG